MTMNVINLDMMICAANEVVERVGTFKPDIVISLENPKVLPELSGPAPRLASVLRDDRWRERQLILGAWDIASAKMNFSPWCFMRAPGKAIVVDALAHIMKYAERGKTTKLLLHCSGGISRSPALGIVIKAWEFNQHMSRKDAIKQAITAVHSVTKGAAPNPAIIAAGAKFLGMKKELPAAVDVYTPFRFNRSSLDQTRQARRREGLVGSTAG